MGNGGDSIAESVIYIKCFRDPEIGPEQPDKPMSRNWP